MRIIKKYPNLSLLLVFIIALTVFSLHLRNELEDYYKDAASLLENGDYSGAEEYLERLGDYKNSAQLLEEVQKELKYQHAIQLYENEEFKESYELFILLGDYGDSKRYAAKAQLADQDRLKDIVYAEAEEHFNEGKYESAIEEYTLIADYKDSLDKIQKCKDAIERLKMAHPISAGYTSVAGITNEQTIISTIKPREKNNLDYSNWNNREIISVAVGNEVAIGLTKDGTAIATSNITEDVYVNEVNAGNTEWTDLIAIDAGERHVVALKNDGHVLAAGHIGDGRTNVNSWENIKAIAAGYRFTVGLTRTGEACVVGYGQNTILNLINENKDEWKDVYALAAGGDGIHIGFVVGLKADHSVVVAYDKTGVYKTRGLDAVESWENIVAIDAGERHIVGLDKDGRVWTTKPDPGTEDEDEINGARYYDADGWTGIAAISAGCGTTVALTDDGFIKACGFYSDNQMDCKNWQNIRIQKQVVNG